MLELAGSCHAWPKHETVTPMLRVIGLGYLWHETKASVDVEPQGTIGTASPGCKGVILRFSRSFIHSPSLGAGNKGRLMNAG